MRAFRIKTTESDYNYLVLASDMEEAIQKLTSYVNEYNVTHSPWEPKDITVLEYTSSHIIV